MRHRYPYLNMVRSLQDSLKTPDAKVIIFSEFQPQSDWRHKGLSYNGIVLHHGYPEDRPSAGCLQVAQSR